MSVNATGADDRAMPSKDRELIARCQAGDQAAYGELVRRYREAEYRAAYAVLGNHEQAEDVVQEAFIRAYRAIGRFDSSYSFAAWIKRITVNCAISALHKRHRALPLDAAEVTSHADPAQHTAISGLHNSVHQALDMLSPQQRAAITLFALEDMDLASTAEAMGCAVGTVKTHLHRARQKLRQALADYLEED